jgi:hypothetical protein
MVILTRKAGDEIHIDDRLRIHVLTHSDGYVQIGFDGPDSGLIRPDRGDGEDSVGLFPTKSDDGDATDLIPKLRVTLPGEN